MPIPADGGDCEAVLAQFANAGIDVDALAAKLQNEGADAFVKSWNELMGVIASRSAALEDPRSTVNRRHPLASVVVIAVMAVLAGANGPTAIAAWAALKEEFLLAALDLPNGIPRKDVFRRVLMALKPAAFQACYVNWLNSLRTEAAADSSRIQRTLKPSSSGSVPARR